MRYFFLGLLISSLVWAGSVKLLFELSPTGTFAAESAALEGKVVTDGKTYQAVDVWLPLESLSTGLELRDEHMKNKYFEVKQYPKALLKTVSGGDGKFEGTLEVHGTAVPVSGSFERDGKEVVADFETSVAAYKIKKAKYLGVGVDDTVKVQVRLPLFKKK